VSIYIFADPTTENKSRPSGGAIYSFEADVDPEINKRHSLQRSLYTICAGFEQECWSFTCHDKVFKLARSDQDALWKIDIPTAERVRVLGELDRNSINAFSLFDSDESLMQTLAFREFPMRD